MHHTIFTTNQSFNTSQNGHNHDHPPNSQPQSGENGGQSNRHNEKLRELVDGTNDLLLKVSTVFPFDFFPDELTIDEYKVNIVFREFFYSEDIHSIMIPLIKDIEVETSLLFGTLKIVPDGYPAQPVCIKFLKKGDALKARRIIQGLMVSAKIGVDTTQIANSVVKREIEDVGRVQFIE